MGHDPFFHALLLLGLLCLCLLLYGAWLCGRSAPAKAIKTRSKEPKPFAGLTHMPPCDACEQATEPCYQALSAPPPRMVSTRVLRRQVSTSTHFCPNPDCSYHGWVGWGNLHANGHPEGGPWRQLQCLGCQGYFQETHGTPLHGQRVSPEMLGWVVGTLAEGLGIRAVARVFEIDPSTVLAWLIKVAEHAAAFSRHFLHDVRATQVQLDELYAIVSAVTAEEVSKAAVVQRLSRSPHWVWVAMDPLTKLLLTLDVGERTLAMAQRVVHQVVQVLAPDCTPLFLTDGFKEYATALLTHYGQWVQPLRRQATGPAPKPRWMPRPELRYAQVVKSYRRRRLVRVSHRVVFGTLAAVKQVLTAHGWQINTAFIERTNLTMRQHVAAIGRRVITFCKHEAGLRQQLALYHVYHNFCLPHASLQVPLPQPEPTHGSGSVKAWRPCSAAMAAGLTDHIWTLRQVLLYRVPPWPQPAGM
jgi:IS1 family transposase